MLKLLLLKIHLFFFAYSLYHVQNKDDIYLFCQYQVQRFDSSKFLNFAQL